MKIGIAGGGIMGRLMAYAFFAEKHEVLLFDQPRKNASLSCSEVAAGMLLPVSELQHADGVIYEMGAYSLQQGWPAIVNQVSPSLYFRQQGSLVVSHPQDRALFHQFFSAIQAKLKKYCLATEKPLIQTVKVNAYEPALSAFEEAHYLSTEGQLDSQGMMLALKSYLLEQGVVWQEQTVRAIQQCVISTEHGDHAFDLVLDCRGMGAKEKFPSLYAVRGECVWVSAPAVTLQRPIRLMHPRYPIYVVPRPHHEYIIGASEIAVEDDSHISVRSLLELLTAAYSIHPGFSEARLLKTQTQCRPTLSHHRPHIQYDEGCLAINGLYRHGFLIAPALMQDVMRWMRGGRQTIQYANCWSFV